jgi:hypothetical protein
MVKETVFIVECDICGKPVDPNGHDAHKLDPIDVVIYSSLFINDRPFQKTIHCHYNCLMTTKNLSNHFNLEGQDALFKFDQTLKHLHQLPCCVVSKK